MLCTSSLLAVGSIQLTYIHLADVDHVRFASTLYFPASVCTIIEFESGKLKLSLSVIELVPHRFEHASEETMPKGSPNTRNYARHRTHLYAQHI